MKTSARREQQILKGMPHSPFEEFSVERTEDLVQQVEKTAPKNSRMEVVPMEDSRHTPCMLEMTAVMLYQPDNPDGHTHIHAMYHYCPTCKIAVRIL